MKFAELMFKGLFYVPEWVAGRETLLKFFFMYMMVNAMHKSNVAATTLEA